MSKIKILIGNREFEVSEETAEFIFRLLSTSISSRADLLIKDSSDRLLFSIPHQLIKAMVSFLVCIKKQQYGEIYVKILGFPKGRVKLRSQISTSTQYEIETHKSF